MKLKFKGLPFVPLLVVLFLLIVSAVTSYVVINQGTGGYFSRADSTRDACDGKYSSSGTKVCNLVQNTVVTCFRNNSINYFTIKQCSSNQTCRNASCVSKTSTSTTSSTSVASQVCLVGVGKQCGQLAPANLNCSPGVIGCSGNATCQSGICKAPATTTTTTNPCFVGLNSRCNQSAVATLHCPDGIISCASPNTCQAGTCKAPTSCFAAGGSACGQSKSTCANEVVGCQSGYSCINNRCQTQDPKPPANPAPPANPGTPTTSCSDGRLCGDAATPVTGADGQTVCGQADGDGVCRSWRCSGGTWTYVGDACNVTPTTVPPTVPPTTTGDATLALTLKLQGVTGNPRGDKTVPFKVKLKGATVTDYVNGTLTADSSGKWTGSVPFSSIALGADTGYSIYVKVGKHLQKRICVESPNESPVGTYSCSDNTIPLSAGQNNLDFTGILQLVGDLPVSGGQNGVVDSQDKGFLLNHQRSTSQADLLIGDLNFDGAIDTNDWSLILQSLNVKYDDE